MWAKLSSRRALSSMLLVGGTVPPAATVHMRGVRASGRGLDKHEQIAVGLSDCICPPGNLLPRIMGGVADQIELVKSCPPWLTGCGRINGAGV